MRIHTAEPNIIRRLRREEVGLAVTAKSGGWDGGETLVKVCEFCLNFLNYSVVSVK